MACRGKVLGRAGGLVVLDCRRCGFAHLSPRPSLESQEELYAHFWSQEIPWYVEHVDEDLAWRHAAYGRLFSRVERMLAQQSELALFDIGCGLGDLMQHVASRPKWRDCVGIDPDPRAREAAKRFGPVFTRIPDWRVNCVSMLMVIEHVLDPEKSLREAHGALSPGGVLVLSVPNDFNRLQRRLTRGRSPWWIHRHHVNYFNWDSLKVLLEKTGFSVEYRTTTFPMELFLLFGDYTQNRKKGRRVHKIRKWLDRLGCWVLYPWMAKCGWGRHLVVLAKKRVDLSVAVKSQESQVLQGDGS